MKLDMWGFKVEADERVWGFVLLVIAIFATICIGGIFGGCAERDAQIAVQTALTVSAEGVQTAADVMNEQGPDLVKRAQVAAEEACADPCSTEAFTAELDSKLLPVTRAMTGLKVARDSLVVAQGGMNIWIATGELPDTDPLCKDLGDAVGPVPRLLTDAGVKNIPAQVTALAGPTAQIACDMIARWAKMAP